jgi:hypothetical protein
VLAPRRGVQSVVTITLDGADRVSLGGSPCRAHYVLTDAAGGRASSGPTTRGACCASYSRLKARGPAATPAALDAAPLRARTGASQTCPDGLLPVLRSRGVRPAPPRSVKHRRPGGRTGARVVRPRLPAPYRVCLPRPPSRRPGALLAFAALARRGPADARPARAGARGPRPRPRPPQARRSPEEAVETARRNNPASSSRERAAGARRPRSSARTARSCRRSTSASAAASARGGRSSSPGRRSATRRGRCRPTGRPTRA